MQQVTHFIRNDRSDLKSPGTTKVESLSDRDAGFCSGEETDLDAEFHSPAGSSSRDSIDTKYLSSDSAKSNKNKRKCVEPIRRFPDDKKRLIIETSDRVPCPVPSKLFDLDNLDSKPPVSPFRPWSCDQRQATRNPVISFSDQLPQANNNVDRLESRPDQITSPSICYIPKFRHKKNSVQITQEEPLALVVEKKENSSTNNLTTFSNVNIKTERIDHQFDDFELSKPQDVVRIPINPPCKVQQLINNNKSRKQSIIAFKQENNCSNYLNNNNNNNSIGNNNYSLQDSWKATSQNEEHQKHQQQQRNYKNMTRERRIEANARERTRVHTISAAFDTLRKSVPAYANDQKLSKLSVLRIACSYIMTLSRIAGYDYSIDESSPSIADCVENVSNTIQLEGKTRKKKDE